MRDFSESTEKIRYWNNELKKMLENKDDLCDILKATNWSSIPTNNISDMTADKAIELCVNGLSKKYVEYSKYALGRINYFMDLKKYIEQAFLKMGINEFTVIELRYFHHKKMDWIPGIMKYSRRQVYRMHESAIMKIKAGLEKMALNDTFYVL